ncbi:MAG: Calx-beta domain-containing protein [Planctomycetota bacterium]
MRYLVCCLLVISVSFIYGGDCIGFLNPQMSVDETAGTLDLVVARTGTGNGAVSVDIQINTGNAVLGVNYGALASTTLNWADLNTTAQVIHLPILHDSVFTFGSYMSLDLVNPTGGATISLAYGTVNISIEEQDPNPAGILTIVAPNYLQSINVHDNDGSVAVHVARHGGTAGPVSVTLFLADQTAAAGVDFTVPGSTTLSWANGEGGTKTLTIPLLSRTVAKGPLNFAALISSSSGTNSGPITAVQINILGLLPIEWVI